MNFANTVLSILSSLVTIVTGLDVFVAKLGIADVLNIEQSLVKYIFIISISLLILSIVFKVKRSSDGDSQFQIFGKKNKQTIIKK